MSFTSPLSYYSVTRYTIWCQEENELKLNWIEFNWIELCRQNIHSQLTQTFHHCRYQSKANFVEMYGEMTQSFCVHVSLLLLLLCRNEKSELVSKHLRLNSELQNVNMSELLVGIYYYIFPLDNQHSINKLGNCRLFTDTIMIDFNWWYVIKEYHDF